MKPLFRSGYWLASISSLAVVAAVIASIVINPPDEVRKHKLDIVRVQDLNTLQNWIHSYWSEHKALPPDLVTLAKNDAGALRRWKDPETGMPYTYEIIGDSSYKLCAVFSLAGESDRDCCSPNEIGDHGSGKSCFSLTVK